jgi:subtilisin-like proprotein convertase family protein
LSKPLLTWPHSLRLRAHLLGAHLCGVQLCKAIIACILTIAATAPLHADPQGDLYYLRQNSSTDNLYRIDPSDLTATVAIGTTSTGGYGGLAPSPIHQHIYAAGQNCCNGIRLHATDDSNNVMVFGDDNLNYYGMAYDPVDDILYASRGSSFVSIDHSGVVTALPLPPNANNLCGLAWGGDGVFALDESSNQELWFFDPQTEEWSSRGSTGVTWYQVGLAYRPDLDVLYAVRGNGYNTLHEINPTTAETVEIGNIGISTNGGGLAWVPADCNDNGVIDTDDIAKGTSLDCNGNSIPDECDVDCDENGIPDECDITDGAGDCNGDGTLDSCEPDCDGNGIPDDCDLVAGAADCNANGVPDACDPDCDGNGVVDECDIAGGFADDCDFDGIPDSCEDDCNGDGIADECQLRRSYSSSPALPINYPNTITDIIVVDSASTIADVDVIVDISHTFIGALQVSIQSPTGTTVMLHNNTGSSANHINGTYADLLTGSITPAGSLEAIEGQAAAGNWTLTVYNNGQQSTNGTLNSWGISLALSDDLSDCDDDGLPDSCEVDCDGNGVPDDCDVGVVELEYIQDVDPDLPISPSNTTTDIITVADDLRINDLDVYVDFTHTFVGAVEVSIASPSGTSVMLRDNTGSSNSGTWIQRFSDSPTGVMTSPSQSLAYFQGEDTAGDWSLSINQNSNNGSGSLRNWGLIFGTGGPSTDCNSNGVPDSCDIAAGTSADCNGDSKPDECQLDDQFNATFGTPVQPLNNQPVSSSITVNNDGVIEDVNVTIDSTLSWIGAYQISLTSPTGTSALILDNYSSSPHLRDVTLSDEGPAALLSAPNLTLFEGEPSIGEWELTILDNSSSYGSGVWNGWFLELERVGATIADCDGSGALDSCEIAAGLVADCNSNGIPDSCDLRTEFYSSLTTPIHFSDNNGNRGIGDSILVPAGGPIQDLDVVVDISHAFLPQIYIHVESPAGTAVTLHHGPTSGSPVGNLHVLYSDSVDQEPGTTDPYQSLDAFDGQDPAGIWTLSVFMDGNNVGDSDQLEGWGLIFEQPCGLAGAVDCNCNGIPDSCDLASGIEPDCDGNGIVDGCDFASGAPDCNGNGILDVCDLALGSSLDCDGDGVPDDCQLAEGISFDCNGNGLLDTCDIAAGTSPDCNSTGIPDECEVTISSDYSLTLTNSPGLQIPSGSFPLEDTITFTSSGTIADVDVKVDISHTWIGELRVDLTSPGGTEVRLHNGGGSSGDHIHVIFDDDGISNGSGGYNQPNTHMQPSGPGTLADFNGADIGGSWALEVLDIGTYSDNGQLQGWSLITEALDGFPSGDCNLNGIPDECEISVFFSAEDCNSNGIPDECDIFNGIGSDCDGSGILDSCELLQDPAETICVSPEAPISGLLAETISVITIDRIGLVADIDVGVEISHTWTGDLDLTLQHNGTSCTLISGIGADGDDLLGTTFNDETLTPVEDGLPPFTGEYQPIDSLSVFDGDDLSGDWTLTITDSGPLDDGTLHSWCLTSIPTISNDCNGNGVLDRCEEDCNGNGTPDSCDTSEDGTFFPATTGGGFGTSWIYFDLPVGGGGIIDDLNVYVDLVNNSSTSYLDMLLIAPDGTSVFFENNGIATGTWEYSDQQDDVVNGTYAATNNPLSTFDLRPADGIWQLGADMQSGSGIIVNWGLRIRSTTQGNDCNQNSTPDDCDLAAGIAFDCNGNGILDECEAADGTVFDCNGNGIADSCEYGPETDCNQNFILDECDIINGIDGDCDGDGVLDGCEVAAGASDCDGNQIPDECQPDCDGNGTADPCDIAAGAGDCDGDGVLDSCESDCNANGTPDDCDIASGTSEDCDDNGIPDECQLIAGFVDCDGNGLIDVCQLFVEPDLDCDGNGAIDICELLDGTAADCDGNGIIDPCDILAGVGDCDFDGVPDPCEPEDCDGDGVPDACAIATGLVPDCDGDELPDSCSISQGSASDCDGNGVPDICTLLAGLDSDCDFDGVLDSCAIASGTPDCDGDAVPDACAISAGTVSDCNGNDIPDSCDIASGSATDADGDGVPDLCDGSHFLRAECNGDGTISIADPVFLLDYLFSGGTAPGCSDGCDGNDDGGIDLSDVVFSLDYLFSGGAPPPPPWPQCGPDPSDDSLNCATAPDCL